MIEIIVVIILQYFKKGIAMEKKKLLLMLLLASGVSNKMFAPAEDTSLREEPGLDDDEGDDNFHETLQSPEEIQATSALEQMKQTLSSSQSENVFTVLSTALGVSNGKIVSGGQDGGLQQIPDGRLGVIRKKLDNAQQAFQALSQHIGTHLADVETLTIQNIGQIEPLMKESIDALSSLHTIVEEMYGKRIPREVQEFLAKSVSEIASFSEAIKSLNLRFSDFDTYMRREIDLKNQATFIENLSVNLDKMQQFLNQNHKGDDRNVLANQIVKALKKNVDAITEVVEAIDPLIKPQSNALLALKRQLKILTGIRDEYSKLVTPFAQKVVKDLLIDDALTWLSLGDSKAAEEILHLEPSTITKLQKSVKNFSNMDGDEQEDLSQSIDTLKASYDAVLKLLGDREPSASLSKAYNMLKNLFTSPEYNTFMQNRGQAALRVVLPADDVPSLNQLQKQVTDKNLYSRWRKAVIWFSGWFKALKGRNNGITQVDAQSFANFERVTQVLSDAADAQKKKLAQRVFKSLQKVFVNVRARLSKRAKGVLDAAGGADQDGDGEGMVVSL